MVEPLVELEMSLWITWFLWWIMWGSL